MMRCLRDMNMSKFVAEDVPLFLSLIDDLFPALKADRASFPEISAALEKVCPVGFGTFLFNLKSRKQAAISLFGSMHCIRID